jgi:hypothetical protein
VQINAPLSPSIALMAHCHRAFANWHTTARSMMPSGVGTSSTSASNHSEGFGSAGIAPYSGLFDRASLREYVNRAEQSQSRRSSRIDNLR